MLLILVCVLFFTPLSAHALDVPVLKGYVNDYAGMISPTVRSELENELRGFEVSDSTQVVILTVPSLEGEVIEEFSIKVAETWKIGQRVKDNGIIFIVAKQERKMRIEVGRGLEGRLTDLMAGRIIDLVVKPKFKEGDFDGGFTAAISSLIGATRGEFKADEMPKKGIKRAFPQFLTFLIIGGIVLLVAGSISRILGGLMGAIGFPSLVHLTLFPLGLITLVLFASFGLLAGIFLPLLFSTGRHPGGGIFPGMFGTGGFDTRGGFFGGGSGGGGDFGGGFSGGGGDFGGGGASGDW